MITLVLNNGDIIIDEDQLLIPKNEFINSIGNTSGGMLIIKMKNGVIEVNESDVIMIKL